MYAIGQRMREEVPENGSVDTQHEGREEKGRGRRERGSQAEKGPVKLLEACCLNVREPVTTLFLWKRTTYSGLIYLFIFGEGHIYLNIKQEYTAIKKMAS